MLYHPSTPRPASRFALTLSMACNLVLASVCTALFMARPSDEIWHASCRVRGVAVVEVFDRPGIVTAPILVEVSR